MEDIHDFVQSSTPELTLMEIVSFAKYLDDTVSTKRVLKELEKAVTNTLLKLTGSKESYYWANRFEEVSNLEEPVKRNLLLTQLADDFRTYSTHYSETIVREMTLPPELRSLDPVDVGGVAGGSKYITW